MGGLPEISQLGNPLVVQSVVLPIGVYRRLNSVLPDVFSILLV
jgi:hypothetical protein